VNIPQKTWLPALLGAVVFLSGWYAVHLSARLGTHERYKQTAQVLSAQAAEIERRLSNTLTSTYILAHELMRTDGEFDTFKDVATNVLLMIPGISNLQLAPQGVIEQIHPLVGNEKAIGHNILLDDARRDEARLAIERKSLTLAGPFELIQGGVAVIGRKPVFLNRDGADYFWGFTSALILLDDLLNDIGLQELVETNTHYQLSRIHPQTGKLDVFAGNAGTDFKPTHEVDIIVPNATWVLQAQQHSNGISSSTWMGYVMTLIATLLTIALSYKFVREPSRLRRLVREQTADLHYLAYHDSLTRLPNRRGFMDLLENCIAQAIANEKPLTVMLIDLDLFKEVNDTLGHQMGDLLLQTVATRLQDCTYEVLSLSRWGGDEFIAILPYELQGPDCLGVANCIKSRLAKPLQLGDERVTVSASIGMAALDSDTRDAASMLKCADLAMYESKKSQRGGYAHYSIEIQLREQRRLELKQLLRGAISREELQLYFQPIVCADTGSINKAEALIRWFSPELGPVNPDELIPVAEQAGLISDIGEWVFQQAVGRVKKWQRLYCPNMQVSINVSPTQLLSDKLAQRWIDCMAASNLATESILVEITETVMLDNGEETHRQINKLLDLSYIKIDRMFIKSLPDSTNDLTLCEAIVTIARQMQLKVVAEGIEKQSQRELLARMGASYLQGYLFSSPLPAADFESVLQAQTQDQRHDEHEPEAMVVC